MNESDAKYDFIVKKCAILKLNFLRNEAKSEKMPLRKVGSKWSKISEHGEKLKKKNLPPGCHFGASVAKKIFLDFSPYLDILDQKNGKIMSGKF